MINILTNCASIPANKVKLSDYPEVKKEEIKNLDLSYTYYDFTKSSFKNSEDRFDKKLDKLGIKKYSENQKNGCRVEASVSGDIVDSFWGCPIFTNIIAPFTLFIVPLYCQKGFYGRAKIISTSNNKTLKEYYLKDKAHEYWSLIATLGELTVALIYPPAFKNSNIQTPESANAQIEQTISQSLTRQILNDAATFPECQKK